MWYLANLDASGIEGLSALLEQRQLERTARMLGRRAIVSAEEAAALTRFHWAYERSLIDSVERFVPLANGQRAALEARLDTLEEAYGSGGEPAGATGEAARVYRRNPDPKGPMTVFGYDYLVDHSRQGARRGSRIEELSRSARGR